ncbi:MAG TPA: tetratricopeptide repeat protein [Candidatus Kapabacteria bacterium]|nr:tetratricopeptide repeat protein [Candidatus Kapabacteria bacterium]
MKIFKQNIIPWILSVLSVLSVTNARAQATDSHVEAALRLIDLGNAREAADDLRALTTQDPKNAEAHAGLAIALVHLNEVAQALPEAQQGFELNRHDALVRTARGIVYGKEGRVEDALDEFHEALSINDKDVGTMVALSRYYISIDSLKAAEITLYQAQSIDDKDVRSYLGLAELYEKQHIPDLAITQYQSAMKLDPNDARVHVALAGLYLRTYHYNESAQQWLDVIHLDSNYADAYYQIANLYFLAKQYPNSAAYAKKYVELKPNDIGGQWLYARALTESGAYQQALPALQAVSANDSLRPLAQMMLARSYFYAKEYPKALEIYKSANSLSPQDLNFYGDALIVSGDTAAGIAQLQKSLSGDTDKALRSQTQSAIGQLLYAQKRYEESAQVFAQMADANPSVTGYLSAGQIYGMAKKPELAKTYYDKALALDPNSLKVRMQMALDALSAGPASDTALQTFEALETAAKTQNVTDTEAIAQGFMGYHYAALKDWKTAVEQLQPSVDVLEKTNSPYRVSFTLLLAQSYHQLQDLDKAKKYYDEVLKLDPDNAGAKQGLEYLKAAPTPEKKHRK